MYELREISRMRKLLGLTQVQLAKMAGISQSLLAKIEAGQVDPSYSRAQKIFNALNQYGKREKKKVADIMVKEVKTVPADATVAEAVRLMNEKAISQLPVVREGKVVGGVTDKMLVEKMASGSSVEDILEKTVGEVMQESFPSVSKDTPLELVASILNYYSALVVYEEGRLAGIITRTDLLRKSQD
ncbi:MAG: CBS domain-containing protein [Nitrososphaerota archaeon]|nr:CBS domain-containing protein [Nitrososphaerota archaeon]